MTKSELKQLIRETIEESSAIPVTKSEIARKAAMHLAHVVSTSELLPHNEKEAYRLSNALIQLIDKDQEEQKQ